MHGRATPAAMRTAFAQYFSGAVTLPGDPLPPRGRIVAGGWSVSYVAGDVNGTRQLDFYATNRFTNDRHVRIFGDGRIEELAAPLDAFTHDPGVPGDFERAERRFFEHNEQVYALLRSKGLL